jgi:hypothetical protein
VNSTQEITKRHQLLPWAERQGCSPQVIDQLTQLLMEAPSKAAEWLQIQDSGTHIASFVNHQLLIAGSTPVDGV